MGQNPFELDVAELAKLPHNDMGNAKRFVVRCRDKVRYTPGIGTFVFDGSRWQKDDNRETQTRQLAHETVEAMAKEEVAASDSPGSLRDWAKRSANRRPISAMVREGLVHLTLPEAGWDADTSLLNVRNGTLELRNGRLHFRPHNAADHLTLMAETEYDPDATCPAFMDALERWQPDPATRRFLRKCMGACLVDSSRDQSVILMHGAGGNGKSVFFEAIAGVLGSYAVQVDPSAFLHFRGAKPGPRPSLVRLRSKRLIRAAEPDDNAPLAESLIKQITGGEPFEVRALYQAPIEVRLQGKIFMTCNKLPRVRGTDEGIWRRLIVIPWREHVEASIGEEAIADVLARGASGILNWLIDGWRDWSPGELAPRPPDILQATQDYRASSDPIGLFVSECCVRDRDANEAASSLFSAYEIWAHERHMPEYTQKAFATQLTKRGLKRGGAQRSYRVGVRLKPSCQPLV